jgi:hypothetical protein
MMTGGKEVVDSSEVHDAIEGQDLRGGEEGRTR